MAYNNPLHTPVPTHMHSSFTSLSPSQPAPPRFLSSRRRRVPQDFYAASSKARNTGRPLNPPISFDLSGSRGQGISMRELCARSTNALSQMIAGANDVVVNQPRLILSICWPGYSHVDWANTIDLCPNRVLLTRAQLAAVIAQNIAHFYERAQSQATRDVQWQLGRGSITLDSLVLVGLINICDDTWVADIAFDAL